LAQVLTAGMPAPVCRRSGIHLASFLAHLHETPAPPALSRGMEDIVFPACGTDDQTAPVHPVTGTATGRHVLRVVVCLLSEIMPILVVVHHRSRATAVVAGLTFNAFRGDCLILRIRPPFGGLFLVVDCGDLLRAGGGEGAHAGTPSENNCSFNRNRSRAILTYSGLISIPIAFRLRARAAFNVVPDPKKGSKIVSPSFDHDMI